jgi:N-acetyl-gamma-glutamyl-phosphate reductase
MIRAAVIGASGYAGVELVRLLNQHPQVTLTAYTSTSYVDEPMNEVYPQFGKSLSAPCVAEDWPALVAENDVIFCALPHGHVAEKLQPEWLETVRVIDLGADFRLPQVETYEAWYGLAHPQPSLLSQAVYGLTEWNRNALDSARLVANPGCYPTASLLALLPLIKAGLIEPKTIVIDAKSGVSGAGRGLGLDRHFNECHESIKAYGLGTHRHTPEIESAMVTLGQAIPHPITFTPHLVPMNRGILATLYADLKEEVAESENHLNKRLRDIYEEVYAQEPFVRLLPEGRFPETRYVRGSNRCDINFKIDWRTRRVIIVSAIDNLVKGAAGQAVQNMNRLFALPEVIGLEQVPAFI